MRAVPAAFMLAVVSSLHLIVYTLAFIGEALVLWVRVLIDASELTDMLKEPFGSLYLQLLERAIVGTSQQTQTSKEPFNIWHLHL